MTEEKPRPRRRTWTLIAIAVASLSIGLAIVVTTLPDWLTRADEAAAPGPAAAGAETRRIGATLYYVSDDGSALVPVSRQIPFGATPDEQARRLVEAQVAAPPPDRRSAIPVGTIVRAVFLTPAQDAYVDLGGTIRSGHSGGSLDEALAIYAIVNTITTNLPDILAVQILIDGQEVDSLAGHLDLRHPLPKTLDWVEKGH